MDFLTSTYDAAASLGKWERAALECAIGVRGQATKLPLRISREDVNFAATIVWHANPFVAPELREGEPIRHCTVYFLHENGPAAQRCEQSDCDRNRRK
jgi:hypothetical protein